MERAVRIRLRLFRRVAAYQERLFDVDPAFSHPEIDTGSRDTAVAFDNPKLTASDV
jgi:hypothetical protein